MSERTVTPEEVWEWIEQDTLPGLRDAARRDYLDMLNSVRASAWDEGYEAGMDDELGRQRGTTYEALSQYTPNPYRKADDE